MKKITPFILALIVLTSSACGITIAGEEKDTAAQRSVASSDSIYSYSQNDIPEVFFFPKDKARWDGSKVTMREWYMLTELQKEKFISEYLREMQGQYKISIDVTGTDYLKALNVFSAYSNDRTLREPSTKFIDILLSGQGKVSGKDQVINSSGR